MGPGPMGPMGPKNYEKVIFSKHVFLVEKMFPDPVGVFCGILGVPSGHMAQNRFFGDFWIYPYFPYRAP